MQTLQIADVVLFHTTDMIKVKDAGIAVPAVYAGMCFEILPDEQARLFPQRVIMTLGLVDIILLVIFVMASAIFQVAFLTRLFNFPVPHTEHGQQAKLAAFRAVHPTCLACFLHDSAIVL